MSLDLLWGRSIPASPDHPSMEGLRPAVPGSLELTLMGIGSGGLALPPSQGLLAMGVVLGAHQPRAVLALWSGVKLQVLTSAKDLE